MTTKIRQTNILLGIILVLFFVPSFVLTSFAQQVNGGCSFSENDLNNLTNNRSLYFGTRGEDVKLLQRFLCSSLDTYFEEKNITGYFGNITKSKVVELQQKFGIIPSFGYFGSITKNYLINNKNKLLKTSFDQNISDVNSKSNNVSSLFSKIKNLQTNNNVAKNYDELDQNFEIKISSSGIKTKDSYIQKFIELSKNTDILSSDLDKLPKKNGVPLSIPSLVDEYVKQGAIKNKEELIGGLNFWNKIVKKEIEQMSVIEVADNISSFHRQTLAWMKYNQKFINDILASDFNKGYLSQKFSKYVGTYKQYGVSTLNNFNLTSNNQHGYFADFFEKIGLAKIANAIVPVPFGGTIAISDMCLSGELLTVTHPMGEGSGAFFLYWTVYALNPFPYKIVTDGNWILGMAYGVSGWCNKTMANYFEGEGTIIYFGTAE